MTLPMAWTDTQIDAGYRVDLQGVIKECAVKDLDLAPDGVYVAGVPAQGRNERFNQQCLGVSLVSSMA